MRDGIYKSLPLGRGWKSLLRSCEREKERGETACVRARRAIIAELCIEVSPTFIHEIRVRARQSESLLAGFKAFDPDLTCRDLGGNNSPFENDVLASAKRMEAKGIRGMAIVDHALKESLDRLKDRRVLQIEQHCLYEGGVEARPMIQAVREAVSQADTSAIVTDMTQGKRLKLPRVKRPIELEEDLTKVN
jgi:hypothetical protein